MTNICGKNRADVYIFENQEGQLFYIVVGSSLKGGYVGGRKMYLPVMLSLNWLS